MGGCGWVDRIEIGGGRLLAGGVRTWLLDTDTDTPRTAAAAAAADVPGTFVLSQRRLAGNRRRGPRLHAIRTRSCLPVLQDWEAQEMKWLSRSMLVALDAWFAWSGNCVNRHPHAVFQQQRTTQERPIEAPLLRTQADRRRPTPRTACACPTRPPRSSSRRRSAAARARGCTTTCSPLVRPQPQPSGDTPAAAAPAAAAA